jgi:trimeric autotransporter adhesin
VQFFADANGDGLPDSGSPIANTGPINAGSYVQIVAVVTVPANAAPQTGSATTRPINFTATSTSNAATTATQTNSLTINAVNAITFASNGFGSVTSPGTVLYTHTVTNNGNENVTALQIAPAAGNASFTYTIYLDSNNNGVIDSGEPVISQTSATTLPTAIAPGGQASIIVQVTADPGVPVSTQDQRVITATATFASSGTASATVQDTTTVVAGNLRLNKTATVDAANTDGKVRPRALVSNAALSEIAYSIAVTNVGSAPVTNVVVTDAVPTYTDFKFGSASVTGCPSGATCAVEYSTDGGTTWSTTAPADTNGNGYSDAGDAARVTHIRVRVLNTGSTPVNAFPSGTVLTIIFTVSVR